MLIGQAAFFRQFPQPFDEVKIWTVWGEEKQLDPDVLCMFFDKVAALVACIVHDHMGVRIWMKKCDSTASYRGSAVSIQAGIWRGRSQSRSA